MLPLFLFFKCYYIDKDLWVLSPYNHCYAILANHMKDNEWLLLQNISQKYKVCHMTIWLWEMPNCKLD